MSDPGRWNLGQSVRAATAAPVRSLWRPALRGIAEGVALGVVCAGLFWLASLALP